MVSKKYLSDRKIHHIENLRVHQVRVSAAVANEVPLRQIQHLQLQFIATVSTYLGGVLGADAESSGGGNKGGNNGELHLDTIS